MKRRIRGSLYEALHLSKKYVPLALIALIPAVIARPETALTAIIAYGGNLLFVTVIFIYGGVSAYSKTISLKARRRLCLSGGIIRRHSAVVKCGGIKSLTVQKSPMSALFGRSRVTVGAGAENGNLMRLFLKRSDERRLVSFVFGRKSRFRTVYRANLFNIFFMAVSNSNAVAGVLIFIPFLRKTGQLLGEYYRDLLYSSLDLSPQIETAGLPPFWASLAGILILGLVISVISVILSYGFFRVEKSMDSDAVIIRRGIIERRIFITRIRDISAFQVRQSLLMAVFKKCSVKFFAFGRQREKQNKKVIMPCIDIKSGDEFLGTRREGFWAFAPKEAIKGYVNLPFSALGVLCLICLLAGEREIIPLYPLILFALAALTVQFIMRLFARKRAFLYADGEKAVISYFQRLSFTKSLVPLEKISCVKITQSIFQRYSGLCSVYVYIKGENKRRFKIKHLKLSDGIEFLRKTKLSCLFN